MLDALSHAVASQLPPRVCNCRVASCTCRSSGASASAVQMMVRFTLSRSDQLKTNNRMLGQTIRLGEEPR